MRKSFWNRRIPSLYVLLFLTITVGITLWFGRGSTIFQGRASAGETPENVQISNLTDTSFSLSYTTDDKTENSVSYGNSPEFGQVALDDRDRASGLPTARQLHYITVSNLSPNTKYYFAISSGGTIFLRETLPYEVTTAFAASPAPPPNQQLLTGSVNLPDGSIPLEGVVVVSAPLSGASRPSQLLSVPLRLDGSYSLPLSSLRTEDLDSLFVFEPTTVLNMTITGVLGQSRVRLFASQANPVPLVSLSTDYDFTTDNFLFDTLTASNAAGAATESGALSPSPTLPEFPALDSTVASGPAILTPENEEKFIDGQPLFEGTALPNQTVEITIESDPVQTSVTSDSFGNWQFRPEVPLAPGEHVITIVTRDAQGVLQTISRSFTVFAEGSQFTEPSVSPVANPTASASATPTIPVTPATLPTTTPTVQPTVTSTPILTPTVTPNLTLTMAALSTTPDPNSLTLTAAAAGAGATIPASGGYTLVIAGFVALLSIGAGFMLFFL